MKLKNKLIPLASGIAVCTTALPLTMLTSCGTNANGSHGFVDLTQKYTPTCGMYDEFEEGESTKKNWAQVTDIYTAKVVENPQIFVDDYLWAMSNNVMDIYSLANTKMNMFVFDQVQLTNVEADVLADQAIPGESVEVDVLVLSFDMEFRYNHSYEDGAKFFDSQALTMNNVVKLTVKNIPYVVYHYSYDTLRLWRLSSLFYWAAEQGVSDEWREAFNQYSDIYDWSLVLEQNLTTTYSDSETTFNKTEVFNADVLNDPTTYEQFYKVFNRFTQILGTHTSPFSYYAWSIGIDRDPEVV